MGRGRFGPRGKKRAEGKTRPAGLLTRKTGPKIEKRIGRKGKIISQLFELLFN
jgi:hypothetical protein